MSASRLFFGVYGFEITRRIDLGQFCLHPRTGSFKEAQDFATNRERFHLTAIGVYENETNRDVQEFLFDLSAALTFCQQQWVAVTGPYPFSEASPEELMSRLPAQLDLPLRRPTSGALIQSDTFAPQARSNFLELSMVKLADKSFDQQTNLRAALFRNVESLKLQQPLIEVTYFMNFTALEILARTSENDLTTDVASVVARFLRKHGYDVTQDKGTERHLRVQTYVHLRNALFHNGQLAKTVNENGQSVTLRLADYEGYVHVLVPDVILKVLGYSDPSIHWNRWIDRMPFQ